MDQFVHVGATLTGSAQADYQAMEDFRFNESPMHVDPFHFVNANAGRVAVGL